MPKQCLAYVTYKDGHSIIAIYKLKDDAPFGFDEMRKWIIEQDPNVVEVAVMKVPPETRAALKRTLEDTRKGNAG